MSKGFPIHAAYQSLLTKGRLFKNPGQAALVDQLGKLQHSLTVGTNPSAPNEALLNNGFYIYGDVGTGKSRIADLFTATLPAEISKRRTHFHEFMIDTHMRLHRARSKSGYSGDPLVQIGQEIRDESRVLCLDEFQVSDIADAMILKRLFGAIWSSGGVLVSTSNRHPTRLYENGLNRSLFLPFIAELQNRCEVWKLEGNQDYRLSNFQSRPSENICFFTNEAEFESSLSKATSNLPLEPVIIPVMMNRNLMVYAAQHPSQSASNDKKIVHATFHNLCEATLGTSDYHALCKFAHTIYLSGLRQFKADELDFVRRFVTLIDIAYESKTRVICLSSVPMGGVFKNIIQPASSSSEDPDGDKPTIVPTGELRKKLLERDLSVKKEGGSSSSMMSTFIGEMEWSATGLKEASLASGGAGETDARFAVGRAVSRLFEMNSQGYGLLDDD